MDFHYVVDNNLIDSNVSFLGMVLRIQHNVGLKL